MRTLALAAVLLAAGLTGSPATAAAGWDEAAKIPIKPLAELATIRLVDDVPCPRPACVLPTTPPQMLIGPSVLAGEWGPPATVYWHELGHVLDLAVLTDADRARLMPYMGITGRPWRQSPNSPHEQFAAAFELCAEFGPRVTRRTLTAAGARSPSVGGYGWEPSASRQRRMCRAIVGLLPR